MEGVVQMIHFLSQHDDVLTSLRMCTTTILEKKEAVKIFQFAPSKSANLSDIATTTSEHICPITVVCSSYNGKLQVLQLKRTSTYVELFLHPMGSLLLDDVSEHDRDLIQNPLDNLGWSMDG